jgi:hypothetical protein
MLNRINQAITVAFTLKSANVKTGPIPTSVTSANSCPTSCPFMGSGCYAESGPLAIHWAKTSTGERGMNWDQFCDMVRALPEGQLFRHNVAGDLPGDNEDINPVLLGELVHANMGRRGFTYTHKTNNPENYQWISAANQWGFTVNLSANNLEHADTLAGLNIGPVVTVLPIDAPRTTTTPAGRTVVTCPATYRDDIACNTCQLCQRQRETIIGFPAHGTSKAKAQRVFFAKVEQ